MDVNFISERCINVIYLSVILSHCLFFFKLVQVLWTSWRKVYSLMKLMLKSISFGKKVEVSKILWLFDTCRKKLFSSIYFGHFRRLIYFLSKTGLRMKLISKKDLIFSFQMVSMINSFRFIFVWIFLYFLFFAFFFAFFAFYQKMRN